MSERERERERTKNRRSKTDLDLQSYSWKNKKIKRKDGKKKGDDETRSGCMRYVRFIQADVPAHTTFIKIYI